MKWTAFYLCVILDVFSRYVVGGMVALRESATVAQRLIAATGAWQGMAQEQVTAHAEHGPARIATSGALLLADLGVTQTHGRLHVSNDTPLSERQVNTLKYHPAFPARAWRAQRSGAARWSGGHSRGKSHPRYLRTRRRERWSLLTKPEPGVSHSG